MSITTTNVVSLGEAARELAASCSRVVRAAEAAGIKPVLVLDRVPHYDADDVQRIGEHLTTATNLRKDHGGGG